MDNVVAILLIIIGIITCLFLGGAIGEMETIRNAELVSYDSDTGAYEIYYSNLKQVHQYEK